MILLKQGHSVCWDLVYQMGLINASYAYKCVLSLEPKKHFSRFPMKTLKVDTSSWLNSCVSYCIYNLVKANILTGLEFCGC